MTFLADSSYTLHYAQMIRFFQKSALTLKFEPCSVFSSHSCTLYDIILCDPPTTPCDSHPCDPPKIDDKSTPMVPSYIGLLLSLYSNKLIQRSIQLGGRPVQQRLTTCV